MLRYHEISEANHRILNPITEEKLKLVGEICAITPGTTHLDLCCGKGEMLSRWVQQYQSIGVGVDISPVFIAAARERAKELGVARNVSFIEGDASQFVYYDSRYDMVSCIGATWIGNGLTGTLELMQKALKAGGTLLVGECYWIAEPPAALHAALGTELTYFASLAGTLDRIEGAGCELIEMVLANRDSWDRYVAAQWATVHQWVRTHADDPDAKGITEWIKASQRSYLEYQRDYLGWGIFVIKQR